MKRATNTDRQTAKLFVYFNPRPREEGDIRIRTRFYLKHDFNPRPREEGDAVAHTGTVSDVDFNPRPREEGDFAGVDFYFRYRVFQSTPS